MKCIPMTGDIDFIVPAVSKNQQTSFVVNSTIDIPNPALITYSWSAPDFNPTTYEGSTFTSTAPEMPNTYSITLIAHAEGYCDLMKTKDMEVLDCTVPGSTVPFTAFNPCGNAATGDYWYLTDTRESELNPSNTQTYKVKKMADGHIWMVQDIKFGNKCNKTTFSGSTSDQTGNVTSLTNKTYYGDCTNNMGTYSPANRGYMYDWAAAINKARAYKGSSYNVGCSGTNAGTNGTNPAACTGICPDGWHIPTGDSAGEFAAYSKAGACATDNDACWNPSSAFEGTYGGWVREPGTLYFTGERGDYWSSTYGDSDSAYMLTFAPAYSKPALTVEHSKIDGRTVRCIKNY
jgi:uncharacterized protein (TIGR02145 family)